MDVLNSSESLSARNLLKLVCTCLFCRNRREMAGMEIITSKTTNPIFANFLILLSFVVM